MTPFKFPGSKGPLLPSILPLLGSFNRYVEPCLGSGAVFHALAPDRAVVADVDAHVIRAHVECDTPDARRRLDEHRAATWTLTRYARVRARASHGLATGFAGDFIAVQAAAFNGLYRRNQEGELNVPWNQRLKPAIPDAERLAACAARIARAEVVHAPAVVVLGGCGRGDAVYLDPPYVGTFTAYGSGETFARSALEEMVLAAEDAVVRGARVVLSHLADPETVARLESTGWRLEFIGAPQSMAANGEKRGVRSELLGVLG